MFVKTVINEKEASVGPFLKKTMKIGSMVVNICQRGFKCCRILNKPWQIAKTLSIFCQNGKIFAKSGHAACIWISLGSLVITLDTFSSVIPIPSIEIGVYKPVYIFFKWAKPRPLFCIFGLFKQTSFQILQQINVKKCHVHPVYGTRIRTHDLQNVSLLS